MSRSISFNQLSDEIAAFGKRGVDLIKDELEAAGRNMEERAKQLAPVDLGTLRRSINYSAFNNGLGARVSVNVKYAAYQEFGTGGLVKVPSEMKELAEHYRGKGVKEINLRPQPFLYPAFVETRKKFIQSLKQGLANLKK